jgi:hypothetical protein
MTTGADWVDSARRLLDAVRPPAASPDQPHAAAAHGADCRWCPVCQTTAVLRGERPEVTAALADVLATTAAVLRDLAGEPGRTGAPPAGSEGPDDAAADPDDGAAPVTVQRIDIA